MTDTITVDTEDPSLLGSLDEAERNQINQIQTISTNLSNRLGLLSRETYEVNQKLDGLKRATQEVLRGVETRLNLAGRQWYVDVVGDVREGPST